MTFAEAYATQRPPWEEEDLPPTVFVATHWKEFIPAQYCFERLLEKVRELDTLVPPQVSCPRRTSGWPVREEKKTPPPRPREKRSGKFVEKVLGDDRVLDDRDAFVLRMLFAPPRCEAFGCHEEAEYKLLGHWACVNHVHSAYFWSPPSP